MIIYSNIAFRFKFSAKNEKLKLKKGGKLADLAPTMLDLMNLEN